MGQLFGRGREEETCGAQRDMRLCMSTIVNRNVHGVVTVQLGLQ